MLAGACCLRPCGCFSCDTSPGGRPSSPTAASRLVSPGRGALLRDFGPAAAIVLACLLVFGLLGGWLLAGRMLNPLARITDATRTASSGSLSHRIRLPGPQRRVPRARGRLRRHAGAAGSASRRTAEVRSQCVPPTTDPAGDHADTSRGRPKRPGSRNDELVDRLLFVNTRAIELTEALLVLSRADQRSFSPENVDLSLIAEEATEALLPLAEKRGVTIETSGHVTLTIGSEALLLQLATNLVHNAIVHNLPEQGRRVGHDKQRPARRSCAQCREHRRDAHATVGLHPGGAFSAWYQTDAHRPRRCRPRAGHRQEHHPSPRRNPHPQPSARWRALRHGPPPSRGTARCRMIESRRRGLPIGNRVRQWRSWV